MYTPEVQAMATINHWTHKWGVFYWVETQPLSYSSWCHGTTSPGWPCKGFQDIVLQTRWLTQHTFCAVFKTESPIWKELLDWFLLRVRKEVPVPSLSPWHKMAVFSQWYFTPFSLCCVWIQISSPYRTPWGIVIKQSSPNTDTFWLWNEFAQRATIQPATLPGCYPICIFTCAIALSH